MNEPTLVYSHIMQRAGAPTHIVQHEGADAGGTAQSQQVVH